MSDRDLLEAAARAGGYKPVRWTDDGTALLLEGVQEPWNALHPNPHSDCMGDALRLFCMLQWMVIETSDVGVTVRERGEAGGRVYRMCTEWLEDNGGDPAAATRRAIVRAAALTQPEGGA